MSVGALQMVSTEEFVKSILSSRDKEIAKLLKEHEDNSSWIARHYDELQRKFPDKYIAVRHKMIVQDDEDLTKLLAKLKEEYGEIKNITINFISTKPLKLLL